MESAKRRDKALEKISHDYQEIQDEMGALIDKIRRLQNEKHVMTNRAKGKVAAAVNDAAKAPEYVTLPPPGYSLDPEASKSELDNLRKNATTFIDKPAKEFPDHPWIISKQVEKLCEKYTIETAKRDQDTFEMHIVR